MKKKLSVLLLGSSLLVMASPAFADYTVNSGDTLSQIAVKENITLSDLERLNPQINNPNLIFVGDVIKTTQSYSSTDLDLLSRLVEAEAGGEPYEGKVAVAETVMNRVAKGSWGNTITSVIYAHGQFSPVANGMINKPATADSIKAAQQVISTYVGDGNSFLYYYAPSKTANAWIRTRPIVLTIANQVFCK